MLKVVDRQQLTSIANSKNCLSCKHYFDCKDPAKSIIYSCSRYGTDSKSRDNGLKKLFDLAEVDLDKSLLSKSGILSSTELDDFDIHSVVNAAVKESKLVPPDLKVPDGDFRLADNFLEFCSSDKFLKQKPFVSQALIGIKIYSEYCPDCSDVEYFDRYGVKDNLTKLQEKICLLKHGKCPACKATKHSFFKRKMLFPYQELALCAGQRSGKSALAGMLAAYHLHRTIKLQNPSAVYDLMKGDVLHGTFVAINYSQAHDTLWVPFHAHLTDSPWFLEYHKMLIDYQHRTGEELLKLNDTFVLYKHRHLTIYPTGPDERALRGRTRFLCLEKNSLISSSKGLIEIKKSSLVGTTTHFGNTTRKIIAHKYMGEKKVWKVRLANGLQQIATGTHEFKIFRNKKLDWCRLEDLQIGDQVVCSLGGEFPLELELPFDYSRDATIKEKLLLLMLDLKHFYLKDLTARVNVTYRGLTVLTGRLKKLGVLTRVKSSSRSPFIYYINEPLLKSYLDNCRNGKINLNRDKLTFPTHMTSDLASLLGYLIADGNYAQNFSEITFTSTSKEKIKDFASKFKKTFSAELRISSWITKEGTKAYNAVFAYKVIKTFLAKIGLTKAWSSIKKVPWSILQAPRNCVLAFVSSALSCDGRTRWKSLCYSSTSKTLIKQMQLLFMRLGYACSSRYGKLLHSVSLSGFESNRFLKEYTGLQKRTWKVTFKKQILGNSQSWREFRIPGESYNDGRTIHYLYTKKNLNKLTAIGHKEENYKFLIEKDLVLSPVISVIPKGIRKVYDIQVDSKDQTFTSNGFAVHNCEIDELGWFDNSVGSTKIRIGAEGIYAALGRSLRTVRSAASSLWRRGFVDVPTGMFFNISSPSSARDKIMELVRKAQGSRYTLGLKRATWEMNPKVPRKDLEDEFLKNPITAMRDYGAEPPLSSNAFLSTNLIASSIGVKSNAVTVQHQTKKAKNGELSRYAEILKARPGQSGSVMALDAGVVNNSFALCIAHLREDRFPVIDAVIEIQPTPGVRLNFSKIYKNIIVPLLAIRNIQLVGADRWNSEKILSDLREDHSVDTKLYSLKYADMCLFKDHIEDKKIIFPNPKRPLDEIIKYDQSNYPACFKMDAIGHFYLQLLTVQDTGNSVIKGDQLTDDMVRAAMLAVKLLLDPENADLWNKVSTNKSFNVSEMGVAKGYSSGSGSATLARGSLSTQVLGTKRTRSG